MSHNGRVRLKLFHSDYRIYSKPHVWNPNTRRWDEAATPDSGLPSAPPSAHPTFVNLPQVPSFPATAATAKDGSPSTAVPFFVKPPTRRHAFADRTPSEPLVSVLSPLA